MEPGTELDNRLTGRPRRLAGHWWEVLTRTLPGRLALLLAAVGLIGLVTAAIGHYLLGAFPSFGESLWSATAHLVDPGSIGDDQTAAERTVGLVQVIAGIIFFAGVVLTVLTEVVDHALRRMRKGDPAVRRSDHLLVIGYSQSLPEVQTRLRENAGSIPPEIVVMLPLDQAGQRDEVRQALDGYPSRATVVGADPGDDGYERVCAREARSIVILSPEGEPDTADLTVTDRAVILDRHLRDGQAAPAVAVELRRGRNVKAFWYQDDPGSQRLVPRFPANFDALVNDRNLGAILMLAVMNPAFAPVFLDDGVTPIGPTVVPSEGLAGRTFGEARSQLERHTLLGVLGGNGPDAKATYLPADERPIAPGERLIAIPDEAPPGGGAAPPEGRIEFTRAAPGPILMLGWSDASRALIEDLEASGVNLERLHLLELEPPAMFHGDTGSSMQLIAGDPASAEDIGTAIARVSPEIVWVAAPEADPSAALVTGMLARQQTEAPIVVEQAFAGPAGRSRRVASGVTVVSTAGLLAETVSLSLSDPALLAAREQMLDDPDLRLETLTYNGDLPLPLSGLADLLSQNGIAPLAVSSDEPEPTHLVPQGQILALRRIREPQ